MIYKLKLWWWDHWGWKYHEKKLGREYSRAVRRPIPKHLIEEWRARNAQSD